MLEYQELIDRVKVSRYLKYRARQISKFNRLQQKEGNIIWSSTPNLPQLGNSAGPANAPSQPGSSAGSAGAQSQAGSVSTQTGNISTSSQKGVQAVQTLSPKQVIVAPPAGKGMQAAHVLLPRQAVLTPFPICHEGVQIVQALSKTDWNLCPSQDTSGATVDDPPLTWTMQLESSGNKDRDQMADSPALPSWDRPNPCLLAVPSPARGGIP